MSRTIRMPGVSFGTSTIDCCRCLLGLSGSVLPITIRSLQSSLIAPDVNHLRPLMTYSPPSRRMLHWMLVASLEATSGSVIEKAERISPASSGSSQRFFCSAVP